MKRIFISPRSYIQFGIFYTTSSTLEHSTRFGKFSKTACENKDLFTMIPQNISKDTKKNSNECVNKFINEPVNPNANIINILAEIGKKRRDEGETHKVNAYKKAIKAISEHPTKITSGKEAMKIKGIGGTCSTLTEKGGFEEKLVESFTKIPKIGWVGARKYYEKGYRSLEDVLANEKLSPLQKLVIKYFNDFENPFQRWEMDLLQKNIISELKSIDSGFIAEPYGCYRLGLENCQKLEIAITHKAFDSTTIKPNEIKDISDKAFNRFVNHLTSKKICSDHLILENDDGANYMLVCRLPEVYQKDLICYYRKVILHRVSKRKSTYRNQERTSNGLFEGESSKKNKTNLYWLEF
nr:11248_t:CDS:2 [Entrophospora candida]